VNYLIDTNIISEVRKGCNPRVAAWYGSIDDESIYLSALVLGEIRKGIERARPKEPAKALALEKWLSTLSRSFAERILPVDRAVADEWRRLAPPAHFVANYLFAQRWGACGRVIWWLRRRRHGRDSQKRERCTRRASLSSPIALWRPSLQGAWS
jgi:predicted nucleic acid-binding protein